MYLVGGRWNLGLFMKYVWSRGGGEVGLIMTMGRGDSRRDVNVGLYNEMKQRNKGLKTSKNSKKT